MSRWIAVSLGLVIASMAPMAAAQAGVDVVLTTDGGMVRGTIVESVPGEHVNITLSNGESRVIAWSRVRYAGPESARPSASVPAPPVASVNPSSPVGYGAMPDQVTLRVESLQTGLTLHEVTGMATASAWAGGGMATIRAYSFGRLCRAPCTVQLQRGSHQLALSQGGDPVIAPDVYLPQDGTLVANYNDRTGLRVAGWLTLIIGGAAGATWMLVPMADSNFPSGDDWVIGMIGGGTLLVVSEIVGLILAMHGDSAELRFD